MDRTSVGSNTWPGVMYNSLGFLVTVFVSVKISTNDGKVW